MKNTQSTSFKQKFISGLYLFGDIVLLSLFIKGIDINIDSMKEHNNRIKLEETLQNIEIEHQKDKQILDFLHENKDNQFVSNLIDFRDSLKIQQLEDFINMYNLQPKVIVLSPKNDFANEHLNNIIFQYKDTFPIEILEEYNKTGKASDTFMKYYIANKDFIAKISNENFKMKHLNSTILALREQNNKKSYHDYVLKNYREPFIHKKRNDSQIVK